MLVVNVDWLQQIFFISLLVYGDEIKNKMEKYHLITEISWEKPIQIQHKLNLSQLVYALNIRFDGIDELWSVMLILEDLKREEVQSKKLQVVKIGFLFPESVKEFLNIGMHFVLSEGPSEIIGAGKILAIDNL